MWPVQQYQKHGKISGKYFEEVLFLIQRDKTAEVIKTLVGTQGSAVTGRENSLF